MVEDPGTADGMNGLVEEQLSITANGQVITGNASYILEHVVANEMNSSMDAEAIKAQAVAAHTYILYYNSLGNPLR